MDVACPTCKKIITWSTDNPFRPFCCERCKLIDLGAWADGSYAVPGDDANIDQLGTEQQFTENPKDPEE